jgi:putative transcriptional regulator
MKRKLFAELTEGFDALKAEREGKRTLRTHAVESKLVPTVTAKELVRVRTIEGSATVLKSEIAQAAD